MADSPADSPTPTTEPAPALKARPPRPPRRRGRIALPRTLDDIVNLLSGPNLIRLVVIVVLIMVGANLASRAFAPGARFVVEDVGEQRVSGAGVSLLSPADWGRTSGGPQLDPPLVLTAPRSANEPADGKPTTISAYSVDVHDWIEEQRDTTGQLPNQEMLVESYIERSLESYRGRARAEPAFYSAPGNEALLLPARLVVFEPDVIEGFKQQTLVALPDTPRLREPRALAVVVVLSYPADIDADAEAELLRVWQLVRASLIFG